MARISAIKFNGSNAYELGANESATSWPQGVQGASQVSVGVELYATTSGSGVTLRLRAIGTSGALLTEINQPYTIPTLNIWQRAESTFDLPAGTDKVELRIIATGGTVLFAQPKLVTGNEPGAYNSIRSPQLTMLTATGIYTGTVSAQQVILTDGGGLNERLTTINSEMIQLEDTVTGKTSRLTADGLYTSHVRAEQVQTGRLESLNGFSWIDLDDGSFSFAEGALSWDGAALGITGRFTSRFSAEKPTRVEVDNGQIRIVNDLGTTVGLINNYNANTLQGLNITTGQDSKYMSFGHLVPGGLLVDYYINHGENPGGWTEKHIFIGNARVTGDLISNQSMAASAMRTNHYYDTNHVMRMSFTDSSIDMWDNLGNHRAGHYDDGYIVRDQDGIILFRASRSGNYALMRAPGGTTDNVLGVDATGAYKIVNGIQTYL